MGKDEKVKNIGDNMLTIVFGVLLFLVCISQYYYSTNEINNLSDYQFSEQNIEKVSLQKNALIVKAKK